MVSSVNALKTKNPALKTIVSIGGWNAGTSSFRKLVSSNETMTTFAHNAVRFLRSHNFDGLDLDWEYPAARGGKPEEKGLFVGLLQVLRQAFDQDPQVAHGKDKLILTIAVGVHEDRVAESYDVGGIVENVDLVNLMMYDFHGQWEDTANVHSALYSQYEFNVDRFVRHWVSNGAPRDKLLMGLPLYGQKFTLADANDNKIGSPVTDGGAMPFFQICTLINAHNITPIILPDERVPYFTFGHLWVGYDDRGSIREKAEYIKAEGLAGAMVWAIDLDDASDSCGMGKFPLMNALKNTIAGLPVFG